MWDRRRALGPLSVATTLPSPGMSSASLSQNERGLVELEVLGKIKLGLRGWGHLQLFKGLPSLQHATARRAPSLFLLPLEIQLQVLSCVVLFDQVSGHQVSVSFGLANASSHLGASLGHQVGGG